MTWLLGKSVLTGLYEKNTVVQSTYQFAEFATTPDYATATISTDDNAANTENSNRELRVPGLYRAEPR